jgi:hypothetical protein
MAKTMDASIKLNPLLHETMVRHKDFILLMFFLHPCHTL